MLGLLFKAQAQFAEAIVPTLRAFDDPVTLPMRRFSSVEGCGIASEVLSCGV